MSTPAPFWGRLAAESHRTNGNAEDFVVTPAIGGVGVTYADCKEVTQSVRDQDPNGAVVDREATFIHVPRLKGTTRPTEGSFGQYNSGRDFLLGAVKLNSGFWEVESLAL